MQKVGIIITIILINNYLEDFNSKGENVEERPAPLQPVLFDTSFSCLTLIPCSSMVLWDD